jgi:hypothetical protein
MSRSVWRIAKLKKPVDPVLCWIAADGCSRSWSVDVDAAVLPGSLATAPRAAQHQPTLWERKMTNRLFVQTNNPAGNHILLYERAADGALPLADATDTGGAGAGMVGLLPILFLSGLAHRRRSGDCRYVRDYQLSRDGELRINSLQKWIRSGLQRVWSWP